ncbi:protein JASON isoform X1 [Cannabis sativa]|uniref:protein JASON isoform X1 n=1 Tax=Cannabis sativa TaxID=3483 RepID=UPI0029CA942A|nr:protein JASON isoform X1 [Cannabis sativa]
MICSLLNRDLRLVCRSVLGYLDRSIAGAMGCFIACFRVRDDRQSHNHHRQRSQPHLVSESSHPKLTEVVVSQNRLSSLFMSEDKQDSPCKNRGGSSAGTPEIDKALKDEAKFLKACGTLAQTPIEIRKASSKWNSSPLQDGDSETSKFHSWLPNTSIEKLQLENQIDQPSTPVKLSEERAHTSGSLECTPSSCVSNVQNSGIVSVGSTEGSGAGGSYTAATSHAYQTEHVTTLETPQLSATNVQRRNKSVRFECDSDLSSSGGSSSENGRQNFKRAESPGNQSISKRSPYPTPLKISDEMQTPGTVFPSNMDTFPNGKIRVRSQYVYPVLNPVENVSQWNALKEEDPNFDQISGELRKSLDQPENASPKSKESIKETLSEELNPEASLSTWLKPIPSTQDSNNNNFVGPARPRGARTPMDRPIIGMVAAHWNEDDPARISPKWWDGNGIPNSTNKYKEDQKVSWHATPFEERLEKALSEESIISQRQQPIQGKPINFDENDESDTALSQLQPSPHPKSLVSF